MNGLSRCPNRPQIHPRPVGEADSDDDDDGFILSLKEDTIA
jgi:hypothetical protein